MLLGLRNFDSIGKVMQAMDGIGGTNDDELGAVTPIKIFTGNSVSCIE